MKTACEKQGITPVEAALRWLVYHSMLKEARGDGIIIGASKLSHLTQNMEAIQAGPLPEAVLDAFRQAWSITGPDSPEYFRLYQGPAK